jgi:translation initiation factor IF-3
MVHREMGYRQLEHVTELLRDIANVENPPRMEGRFLSMILVPNREAIVEAKRTHAAKAVEKSSEHAEAVPAASGGAEAASDARGGAANELEA